MKLIDIPSGMETLAFAMSEDAINDLPEVLSKFFPSRKPFLVADGNTWQAAGRKVEKVLNDSGMEISGKIIYSGSERLHPDYSTSLELAEKFSTEDVPVAVGSGVINDIVKCASGKKSISYCCVPTAPSVDGYTASGGAMSVDGTKMTVPCPAPAAVVAELEVLRNAPPEMLASGYADLMTKVPAGADWIIADMMNEEKIDRPVWDLVQKNIRDYVSDSQNMLNVFSGLAATGYAMQLHGTSRPASGLEHLCSHVWEMEHLSFNGIEISHGFKVGIGSLISTLLMEYLLNTSAQEAEAKAVAPETESERISSINELLKKGCYGDKTMATAMAKFKQGDEIIKRRKEIFEKWESFKEPVRKQMIPYSRLKEMLKKANCPTHPAEIGLDREQLIHGVRCAQLIRIRYNIADLLYEAGLFEDAIKTLDILFE